MCNKFQHNSMMCKPATSRRVSNLQNVFMNSVCRRLRRSIKLMVVVSFFVFSASCHTLRNNDRIVYLIMNLNDLTKIEIEQKQTFNLPKNDVRLIWDKIPSYTTNNIEELIKIGNPAIPFLIIALSDERLVGIELEEGITYPQKPSPIKYGVSHRYYAVRISDLADYALRRITQENYGFFSYKSAEERTNAINSWYAWWVKYQ